MKVVSLFLFLIINLFTTQTGKDGMLLRGRLLLFLVLCLMAACRGKLRGEERDLQQVGGAKPPLDPISQQVNDEVSKVVKITSGLKRIGGPGLGGIPGGWSSADVKSKDVLAVANWAAERLFPLLHPSPRVLFAMQQVVAGLNYNLTLAITRLVRSNSLSTTCSTVSVAVWDRFGTFNLMKNQTMSTRC